MFLVIQIARLGDTLLSSSLCKNIKNAFPDYKLVYIVSKSCVQVAKRLDGVDEVFEFDKKIEHKGLLGIYNFAKNFKYRKNVDFSIILYRHERAVLLNWLIGSKCTACVPFKGFNPLNFTINNKIDDKIFKNIYKNQANTLYLKDFGVEPKYYPSIFHNEDIQDEIWEKYQDKLGQKYSYIVLSPSSANKVKDWDKENVLKFIQNSVERVVITGLDEVYETVEFLKKNNADFIDLSSKTTILELSVILKYAKCTISVDTGSMHLSYMVKTPTVCLFFNQEMISEWVDKNNKKIKVFCGNKCEVGKNKQILCKKNVNFDEILTFFQQNPSFFAQKTSKN